MTVHDDILADELFERQLLNLLEEANKIRVFDLEGSIQMAFDVLEKARLIPNNTIVAQSQNLLGLFFMVKGEYENSRLYSNEAFDYFKSIDEKKGMADAIFNIASTYYKTDNFHKGLMLLLQCKQLYGEIEDHGNIARVLKSIGTIHEYFGDTNKAVATYEQCVESARIANEPNIESNAYNPLSGIYLKRHELAKAMEMAEKSIAIKLGTKDERGLAFSIYGRGKVYLKTNQYEKAIIDFLESLRLHQKMGDRLGEGMSLNKLGESYYFLEDLNKAIYYLDAAVNIGVKFNISLIIYKANYTLYLTYKKQGNLEKSLACLESYNLIKEAKIFARTAEVITSYEALFELEKLERETKAQKELYQIIESKNEELDSFFYRVSHDLKGPINSLLGLYTIIRNEEFGDAALRYFNLYNSQVIRLNTIILDLINLTQMKSNQVNNVKIDFNKITKECVESYSYYESFKRIQFIYDIEEGLDFYSQWVIINTILQNLIENAIKYSREDVESFIRISVNREGKMLYIKMEDNGMGISEENQSNIFNMFFRVNSHVEGTGLGLYILSRAVQRLKGEVKLKSDLGKGTTFIVALPFS
jgi:signal transduction histidine kinase